MSLSIYLNEHSIPALISGCFCILLYIDSSINNIKRSGRDYIKAFIVLYCLSYLSIYMFNNTGKQMSGGGLGFLGRSPLREEIFIGNPNF
jgi:hypothetical protein